ncbi:MAG TPA: ADOP family duplicated permease [Opitutaceae bacterium]|nr:ADOP family duplicated permease [Opitutaceae bacterium]
MNLLRHGYTSFRRSPLLAFTIIVTLGASLAAAVVVFSFLNTFLLRPLPYGDSSRLAVIYEYSLKGGRDNFTRVTYGNLIAIQERTSAFSRTGIFRNESATFHGGESTETAFLQRVTADIFPMMGARAALGSVITPANLEVAGVRTIVLSDSLWRRRFGGDPAIIGRTIRLDDTPFHVVGVMPASFVVPTGDDNPQAWAALLRTDYVPNERLQRRHHVWAELAPGKSLAAADAELSALAGALRQEFPKENLDRGLFIVSLRQNLLGGFGRQLVLLQGAVLLVLVVACFNCLCLLIARAIQRRREFAVRLALGAARRHLLAQLFAESLWLALPAAALGLGLAALALPAGAALVPTTAQLTLQAMPTPHVDFTVAAAVIGTALLIALGFSAVPLLQTRRLNLEATLREGGRSAGAPGAMRAARLLAGGQIAVALALLICAALLLRSQRALHDVDVGLPIAEFDQFRVGLRGNQYATNPALRAQFFERLRDNLRAAPGVKDVGVASFLFSQPPLGYQGFVQEGDGLELAETPKRALPLFVLPGTLEALGFRLVQGRSLAETDLPDRAMATVINASLAAKYWPGQSALGKRVKIDGLRGDWAEVVGVVADVLGTGDQPRVVDTFYLTLAQGQPPGLGMGMVVRHAGVAPGPRAYLRALEQLDPNMQFFLHIPPTEIYRRSAWQSRFVTQLVVAFALLAVALSLAGIYAVNAFLVARRINEFGIRAALGATQGNLQRLVLAGGLRLTAAGLAGGALLAFAATRSLTSLLYNAPVLDVAVYVGAAALMTLACLGAMLLPARRAARVDPLIALRAE